MKVLKLIARNLFRHKLRSSLTVLGIAIAVLSFGLLRTVIAAWFVGIDAASPNRLVTRHSVSFIFPLPVAYLNRIASVEGVVAVSRATWFQGVYIDESHFFPRMAIDDAMWALYPEYRVPDEQLNAYRAERNACIIGRKIAAKYGLKPGDPVTITGDIFPGRWDFVVRGIYRGMQPSVDETQLFFHWEYLNEALERDMPVRAGYVGWYTLLIDRPENSARISEAVDAVFRNSPYETKTETEKAFTQGFISMASTIIQAIEFISFIIIGIILLVLANTMVMTARERVVEYAVLKTLGFRTVHIMGLITGESLLIAVIGAVIGMLLTFPAAAGVAQGLSTFFPVFIVQPSTLLTAGSLALLIGILASLFPLWRAMHTSIVEGLRHIG
jgi:putative ABC transport system permease protein